jgi:hypothetical protein
MGTHRVRGRSSPKKNTVRRFFLSLFYSHLEPAKKDDVLLHFLLRGKAKLTGYAIAIPLNLKTVLGAVGVGCSLLFGIIKFAIAASAEATATRLIIGAQKCHFWKA